MDVHQALARHGDAVATARAFAERSGARRVMLLLDRGAAGAVLVDCAAGGDVEIVEGEQGCLLPGAAAVPVAPRALPELRPAPASAVSIDLETGELSAPVGTMHHLADAVLALARAFGGRTVATAEFATADPRLPITLAAREGERPVLEVAGQEFLLP